MGKFAESSLCFLYSKKFLIFSFKLLDSSFKLFFRISLSFLGNSNTVRFLLPIFNYKTEVRFCKWALAYFIIWRPLRKRQWILATVKVRVEMCWCSIQLLLLINPEYNPTITPLTNFLSDVQRGRISHGPVHITLPSDMSSVHECRCAAKGLDLISHQF